MKSDEAFPVNNALHHSVAVCRDFDAHKITLKWAKLSVVLPFGVAHSHGCFVTLTPNHSLNVNVPLPEGVPSIIPFSSRRTERKTSKKKVTVPLANRTEPDLFPLSVLSEKQMKRKFISQGYLFRCTPLWSKGNFLPDKLVGWKSLDNVAQYLRACLNCGATITRSHGFEYQMHMLPLVLYVV